MSQDAQQATELQDASEESTMHIKYCSLARSGLRILTCCAPCCLSSRLQHVRQMPNLYESAVTCHGIIRCYKVLSVTNAAAHAAEVSLGCRPVVEVSLGCRPVATAWSLFPSPSDADNGLSKSYRGWWPRLELPLQWRSSARDRCQHQPCSLQPSSRNHQPFL